MFARNVGRTAVSFLTILFIVVGIRVAADPTTHPQQVHVTSAILQPTSAVETLPNMSTAATAALLKHMVDVHTWNVAVLNRAIWHNFVLAHPPKPPVVIHSHISTAVQVVASSVAGSGTGPTTIACGWDDRSCWRSVGQTIGSINGNECGGDLPSCCTLRFESGGSPAAQNPGSSASGLWQFMHDTWGGYGGVSEAKYASASVQNDRARQIFAGGAGAGNWFGDGCYNGR